MTSLLADDFLSKEDLATIAEYMDKFMATNGDKIKALLEDTSLSKEQIFRASYEAGMASSIKYVDDFVDRAIAKDLKQRLERAN